MGQERGNGPAPPAGETAGGTRSGGVGAGAPSGRDARATGAAGRPAEPGRARLTSRAAVLAVVVCAIALSLAYPVREFIAQHRQIAQLEAQHNMAVAQVRSLQAEQQRLLDPGYVEEQARARLNMCMPNETCYVIIDGRAGAGLPQPPPVRRSAWYAALWKSVQQADRPAAR